MSFWVHVLGHTNDVRSELVALFSPESYQIKKNHRRSPCSNGYRVELRAVVSIRDHFLSVPRLFLFSSLRGFKFLVGKGSEEIPPSGVTASMVLAFEPPSDQTKKGVKSRSVSSRVRRWVEDAVPMAGLLSSWSLPGEV